MRRDNNSSFVSHSLSLSFSLSLYLTNQIVEATATQRGSNVPVTYATLSYTELTGKPFTHEIGYTYIQAYPAAVLRADYNIDPSSFYPLPGVCLTRTVMTTCFPSLSVSIMIDQNVRNHQNCL